MDSTVIFPLAAVALGWFLNELAGAFRVAREERQLVRSALPALVQLYFEQYRINDILSFFARKMGDDFEDFYKAVETGIEKKGSINEFFTQYLAQHEKMRRANIALPEVNRASLIQAMLESTSALARVDPVSAYRAKKLLSEFVLFQETELPSLSNNYQFYVKQWSLILEVYRTDLSNLRGLILRVALKVGVMEYLRVRNLLTLEESELLGGTEKAYKNVQK